MQSNLAVCIFRCSSFFIAFAVCDARHQIILDCFSVVVSDFNHHICDIHILRRKLALVFNLKQVWLPDYRTLSLRRDTYSCLRCLCGFNREGVSLCRLISVGILHADSEGMLSACKLLCLEQNRSVVYSRVLRNCGIRCVIMSINCNLDAGSIDSACILIGCFTVIECNIKGRLRGCKLRFACCSFEIDIASLFKNAINNRVIDVIRIGAVNHLQIINEDAAFPFLTILR